MPNLTTQQQFGFAFFGFETASDAGKIVNIQDHRKNPNNRFVQITNSCGISTSITASLKLLT